MSLEKGAIMFQPGDAQFSQAWSALLRKGLDPSKYDYMVSVENNHGYIHKFKQRGSRKSVEVMA